MHVPIIKIIHAEHVRSRAYVAFLEEIASEVFAINNLCYAKHPYIKLSFRSVEPVFSANEYGVLNVPLNHPCFPSFTFLQKLLQKLDVPKNLDPHSSIRVFAWLADPHGILLLANLFESCEGRHICVGFYTVCLWQVLERVLSLTLIEFRHRIDQFFFICQTLVILYFGINLLRGEIILYVAF